MVGTTPPPSAIEAWLRVIEQPEVQCKRLIEGSAVAYIGDMLGHYLCQQETDAFGSAEDGSDGEAAAEAALRQCMIGYNAATPMTGFSPTIGFAALGGDLNIYLQKQLGWYELLTVKDATSLPEFNDFVNGAIMMGSWYNDTLLSTSHQMLVALYQQQFDPWFVLQM